MSSYFDEFDAKVHDIRLAAGQDDSQFIKRLARAESSLITDCLEYAYDHETPTDIKEKIIKLINENEVIPERNCPGTEFALVCKRSKLSSELHSFFHEIASRRMKTRYTGFVNDNPGHLVRMIKSYLATRQ